MEGKVDSAVLFTIALFEGGFFGVLEIERKIQYFGGGRVNGIFVAGIFGYDVAGIIGQKMGRFHLIHAVRIVIQPVRCRCSVLRGIYGIKIEPTRGLLRMTVDDGGNINTP